MRGIYRMKLTRHTDKELDMFECKPIEVLGFYQPEKVRQNVRSLEKVFKARVMISDKSKEKYYYAKINENFDKMLEKYRKYCGNKKPAPQKPLPIPDFLFRSEGFTLDTRLGIFYDDIKIVVYDTNN